MKKYRLIKEYPGSPELGSILTYGRIRGDYAYNNDNLNVFRHKNEIENHPEFWEEIIEKDYEILSYKYNNDIYVLTEESYNKKDKVWRHEEGILRETTLHYLTLKPTIHSVKRLSDG